MVASIASINGRRRRKPDATGWKAQLAAGSDGFLGDERNVLIALRNAPELVGLVRYNDFSLQVELTRDPPWRSLASDGCAWGEVDDTQLLAHLQAQDIRVRGPRAVADSIVVVAKDATYHPVRAYLDSLSWDGTKRVEYLASRYLGAGADPTYASAIGARFLVSAVARVMRPGCQADHSLVLEGSQGIGKTTAARILSVRPEWFAGSLPDITGKDAQLQLVGRWFIEIAELRAIRSSQLEVVKSFLTQTHDVFRPPFGRRTAQFPRQCVFVGTTNEHEYLRDPTGNRRYWPLPCEKIDLTALQADRDQLWAEAVAMFRSGAQWHLTPEEQQLATREQADRVHVSELEHDVAEYLSRYRDPTVTVRDVMVFGLHIDPDKTTYTETARKIGPSVAEAMKRCGWARDARRGRDHRTVYIRAGGQG